MDPRQVKVGAGLVEIEFFFFLIYSSHRSSADLKTQNFHSKIETTLGLVKSIHVKNKHSICLNNYDTQCWLRP